MHFIHFFSLDPAECSNGAEIVILSNLKHPCYVL